MLKEYDITKIALTDRQNVVVDLQVEQFNYIYDVFGNSEFKTIYSNICGISSNERFSINCSLANGNYVRYLRVIGDVVEVWVGGLGGGTYRIKNINWTAELAAFMNG